MIYMDKNRQMPWPVELQIDEEHLINLCAVELTCYSDEVSWTYTTTPDFKTTKSYHIQNASSLAKEYDIKFDEVSKTITNQIDYRINDIIQSLFKDKPKDYDPIFSWRS